MPKQRNTLRAAAIILAGGKSSRMGRDKSLLPFGDQPLVQRIVDQLSPLFEEVIIGTGHPNKLGFLGCRTVCDEKPDQGPLMGIVSCLSTSSFDVNFVTACDIPDMNRALIARLVSKASDNDAVVLRSEDGRPEPLFAVYRKCVIEPGRTLLAEGRRRVADLLPLVKVKYVEMPRGGWYRNLNTVQDYLRALSRAKALQADPRSDASPHPEEEEGARV